MMNQYLPRRKRRLRGVIIVLVILAFILLGITSGTIEKWLWMGTLNYNVIFWEIFLVQWVMFALAFAIASLYVWINLRPAAGTAIRRLTDREGQPLVEGQVPVTPGGLKVMSVLVALGFGVIFGLVYYPEWDAYLRFRYGSSFGLSDPLFHTDVAFYVFRLPFYQMVQNSLSALTLMTFLLVLAAYAYFGLIQMRRGTLPGANSSVARHLSVLLTFVVASWAWGFYLDHYQLLFASRGVVYGAGYTADHVTRISLWIMFGASIALCAHLILNSLRPHRKALLLSGGFYIGLYAVTMMALPPLTQTFRVQPNELELETPYLRHNIQFTRTAFQLDRIKDVTYPALADLTPEAVARNEDTIQNVRLWDWRLLLQTYRQTQEIRLYYQFYDVDVDRYHLPDGYHQVMLSARELSEELPEKARTWFNQYLQFTHGYGIVMSFVSKIIGGGFPQYLLQNIPPESAYDLTVDRPAIYYGERMPGYRIVSTGVKEFDYPKGDQNVYTSYQGKGGVPINSLWRRLLFAWTRSDINILLSSYLGPSSKIQLWRDVHDRVEQIAPFLLLDRDPYAVLSKGKLYWIQDAYTSSDHFPYSTPSQNDILPYSLNYMRNSVKVVVDMYDGTVDFYIMDPNDPVLGVYRKAFPGVFKDLDQLPGDLKQHLRYPEDLFSIQADQYRTFHMVVPQVLYNQEDLWVFPQEKYAGESVRMQPYYILMKLPGTDRLEFLLMTPFTPQNRDNMIAWMAARCDFPGYGSMLEYQLPKEKLVYGPLQIEAMIDQNPLISQQLSLWDQRGSRAIRGNLIVLPIDNSFLYVEPVYLTAEGTNIPQLKRIIVVSGDKVVMEPTLDEAIKAIFGAPQVQEQPAPAVSLQVQQQLSQVTARFEEAEKAMREGAWDRFGKAMEALKGLLTPSSPPPAKKQ